ncbi:NUDIX domain-containing protein [Streptomyces sp. NPDC057654]|uniref:NUDIX domain-containing protein n=1 Tax=Streptomyces sp. NPDC057654 TaxID=3346196 RepID=UPI00368C8963
MNASAASHNGLTFDPELYTVALRALIVSKAGVLLIRPRLRAESDDRWYRLPGGPGAEGEMFPDALVRHIREQTGLSFAATAATLRAMDSTPGSAAIIGGVTFYYSLAAAPSDHVALVLSEKHDHATWATDMDLEHLCTPSQVTQVKAALAALRDDDVVELYAGRRRTAP